MSEVYVWPHNTNTPPEPFRRMLFMDSNAREYARHVQPGVYGAVFNPGFQKQSDWLWWATEIPKIRAAWDKRGIVVPFIFIDLEWKEHEIPYPWMGDVSWIANDFDTARIITQKSFPGAVIYFHGDHWVVENVSWTGLVTGYHSFFGWQARTRVIHGMLKTYTNMFWQNQNVWPSAVPKLATHGFTHWLDKAKIWIDTGKVDAQGQPIRENGDFPVVDAKTQYHWGQTIAKAETSAPVLLYWADDSQSPNFKAFHAGFVGDAQPETAFPSSPQTPSDARPLKEPSRIRVPETPK